MAALLAFLLLMVSMQTRLVFPTHAVGPAGPLPRRAIHITTETPDGNTLHGIHIPPVSASRKPGVLVIGFGGNGWNAADVAAQLHQLFAQAEIVVFHYRGYAPSTGSPSAEALLADAPLIHDFAVNRVKPDHIVAVGFSIGSGVAASLAGRRPLDGMILVTPFDSLKTAASDLYPWLPVATFFEHELDTATYLEGSPLPVAIISGDRDTLIRPARTQALRQRVPNLAYDRTIEGAGHNDIYHRLEFRHAMSEAWEALRASGEAMKDLS